MDLLHLLQCSVIWICFTCFQGIKSRCTFPPYLWRPQANGTERTWVTQTQFFDKTDEWESQMEIIPNKHSIVAKILLVARCDDYAGTVPCFKRHIRWEKTCMDQPTEGRYKVFHKGNGRSYYTCIKLVKLHHNIAQIWSGPEFDENSDDICQGQLSRNQWPWIDSSFDTWSACPMTGGYDFRAYIYGRRKRLCRTEWRSSRMESECILGEGLTFTFPEDTCSPFIDSLTEYNMQCVGYWTEHNYLFMVGRYERNTPQYIMRVPSDYKSLSAEGFSMMLYFSPIAPIGGKGIPDVRPLQGEVRYTELTMKSSERGTCYDESELCAEHAAEKRCINLSEYGNYCKRSCGFCGLLESRSSECRFPSKYLGDLHLYSTHRHERVYIHSGYIEFASLGEFEFVCKKKHWELNQYKLLSYFNNGCRPRYTCVEFGQETDHSLEYRMSKSDLQDRSFDLCQFSDDPPPLLNAIRSAEMKTLIPENVMRQGSCGINGIMRMSMTLANGRTCSATFSDWNTETCMTSDRLHVTLRDCRHPVNSTVDMHEVQRYLEYECSSYLDMSADRGFLITRPIDDAERYQCWIIETFPEMMSLKPWKIATQLSVAECPMGDPPGNYSAHVIFTAYRSSAAVSTPCPHKDNPHNPAPSERDSRNSGYSRSTARPPRGGQSGPRRRKPSYLGNTDMQGDSNSGSLWHSSSSICVYTWMVGYFIYTTFV